MEEKTARNNLNQTLHRLRRLTGEELVHGGDVVVLDPRLEVDVGKLELLALSGQAGEVVGYTGELLNTFDYDDLP